MTSDFFNEDPAARTTSSRVLTREKIMEMIKDLQLPPPEKFPFRQNYLGEFPKFEYVKERRPSRLFKIRNIIIHDAYSPYTGFRYFIPNKIQRAAQALLKVISERQMEEMCNED